MAECIRPVIDLTPPAGLPICVDPEFLIAEVVDAQFPQYPDVEPPPFCFCINNGEDIEIGEDDDQKIMHITDDEHDVVLKMIMTNDDCCAPEFEFEIESSIPCLPLEVEPTIEFSEDSTTSFDVTRQVTEEVPDPDNPGETIEVETCRFEFDITIPPLSELEVLITHSGPGITYIHDCEAPADQTGIQATAEWDFNVVLGVRQLHLDFYLDFGIPLISAITYADGTDDTVIDLPPDSEPGSAVLSPLAADLLL